MFSLLIRRLDNDEFLLFLLQVAVVVAVVAGSELISCLI